MTKFFCHHCGDGSKIIPPGSTQLRLIIMVIRKGHFDDAHILLLKVLPSAPTAPTAVQLHSPVSFTNRMWLRLKAARVLAPFSAFTSMLLPDRRFLGRGLLRILAGLLVRPVLFPGMLLSVFHLDYLSTSLLLIDRQNNAVPQQSCRWEKDCLTVSAAV